MDESPYVITTLLEKIPSEVKFDLLKQERDNGGKWTAHQWREGLASLVQLRETARVDREPPVPRPNGHVSYHTPERVNGQRYAQNQPRRVFPVVKTPTAHKNQGGMQNPNFIPITTPGTCSLCENGGHRPTNCPRYNNPFKRRQRLTEQNRCLLCIRSGHEMRNCSLNLKCSCCGERHHLIICSKYGKGPPISDGNKGGTGKNIRASPQQLHSRSSANAVTAAAIEPEKGRNPSYLMVMPVKVYNHRDPLNPCTAPIFFDPGSQNSFIETLLTREINPRRVSTEELIVGGFVGNRKESFVQFTSPCYSVMLAREDGGWEEVFLNRTDKITPSIECLVDQEPTESPINPTPCLMEPKILIGVREFWRFIRGWEEIRPGIFKIQTILGTVFGGEEIRAIESFANLTHTCPIVSMPSESEVAKFWALETIGVADCPQSNDNEIAIEDFKRTIKRDGEGRYEVALPWKSENEIPPENFRIAFSRLSALIRKFRDSPQLFEGCNEVIKDYLERGIIEESRRVLTPQHFLPHHVVIGKRLRIVFDASSHEKGVHSLNECLYPGPNLYPDLAGKLIQFRATIYPIWADIEKAFLMISLREADREFSKFLWIKDVNSPISGDNLLVFRFRRITFGIVSCPFLLAATLRHHLDSHNNILAQEINEKSLLYVDNLLLLADTENEARHKAHEAKSIFAEAKMRLREFTASEPTLLDGIPEEDKLGQESPSVLGLKWVLSEDVLILPFPPVPGVEKLTRRIVLKTIASFFDPLGLCSPCLVKAKLFFQGLWEQSRGWDEPINETECENWNEIKSQWDGQAISVPRHTPRMKGSVLQVHVFTDASPQAFSTAVYLRTEGKGSIISSLIYARSRIRPKKMGQNQKDGLTIPRLELLGVLIGVRAAKFVQSQLFYELENIYLWSDSRIVLSWLSSTEKLPIFVENRIREIRKHRDISFRYVRSADNPADLATRSVPPDELKKESLWWNGPNWLTKKQINWPDELTVILPPEESPNPEPVISAALLSTPAILEFERFGSWNRLSRCAFRVVEFLSKIGKKKRLFSEIREKGFCPETQSFVRNWLFKIVQRGMFPPAQAYLSSDGLIRLTSRLTGLGDKDFEHPIVIPSGSWALSLLIRQSHECRLHAGIDSTLTEFLSKFWCKRARRMVRKVINDCNICKRDRAVKFGLPPMPPLPKSRTRPSLAFENVGIDFLGPTLFKTVESGPAKAWVLLITCLACRAVHLEIVSSLSADHFLLAFRRFVARRGTPKTILSDHGTQFVLTKSMMETCTDFCIKWTLIPAFSPWSGGVYERLNALIKSCFRRVLGRKLLNWEEIGTFLTEVEASINSRPITFVSDEADGPLPLRPIDFLSPKANLAFEEPRLPDELYKPSSYEKLAARWWATNKAIRNFWDRWSQEYLLILRQRNQNQHKGPRIFSKIRPRPNQIVLVEQEEFPRNTWPLGRIEEVQGPENNPRSANILMPNGRILSRPVSKLVPLEEPPEVTEKTCPPLPGDFLAENVVENELMETNLVENEPTNQCRPEIDKCASRPSKPAPEPIRRSPRTPKPFSKWDDRPRRPTVSFALISKSTLSLLMLISYMCGAVCAAPGLPAALSAIVSSLGSNTSASLTCTSKGAIINGPSETQWVEVCCDKICGSREYKGPFPFLIPEEYLLLGFSCNTVFWTGQNTSISHFVNCAPVDVCLLLDCYWCLGRVFNLHCSPVFSAILIGSMAMAFSMALICLCCLLNCTRCFLRSLCHFFISLAAVVEPEF